MQQLVAQFIPAADASDRLQNKECKDEDALLYQKFSGKFTVASARAGGKVTQGQYAVAPSGELLASCATADPKEVAAMMRQAIERWENLPRARRLLPEAPNAKSAERWRKWEKLYPADGLVLHVVSRDLPRKHSEKVPPVVQNAWNQDFAWFHKKEARTFLPAVPRRGQRYEVPRNLVERLARFHLLDNVRALNYAFFPKAAVKKASLTVTVVELKNHLISLLLEGETQTSTPAPQERGYEPKLLGRATYDLKEEKFTTFELVAVGKRWGAGNCNLRHDDVEPQPMGIVLKLAGTSPAERLPPTFISRYGW